ncbi:MAG TPA: sigma-54 dependent transcriptional regulator [Polyangiaceae bacterium]|nr:sigma-54 dependent transcriptional regulator [Polyangiaceae bacterium]
MSTTILIVDDDRRIRELLGSALEESGYRARTAESLAAARTAIADEEPDAILLDIRLRDGDGLAFLAELRREYTRIPVIMATAYGDSDRTIAAMKGGAFDYVTKPFDVPKLLESIRRAVHAPPRAAMPEPVASTGGLVGSSSAMLDVWKAIGRAAASEVAVLITGESGVGKELIARSIHANSGRARHPFVAVNIASLAPTLVESELFGHEKGAFTGASSRREGRFELATEGTLFLDEIGDLDLAMQTKLLRVLEDGSFERVGSQTPLRSRARIVAATSKPVVPGSAGVTLREDLFYRIGVVCIEVPALRDRRSDIPLLIESFLRSMKGARRAVTEEGIEHLMAHDWPGNVRELRHVLERACVMSSAEVLGAEDLGIGGMPGSKAPTSDLDLRRNLETVERDLIKQALARAQGNRAEAARLLGIHRPLLYARMRALGLTARGQPREGGG